MRTIELHGDKSVISLDVSAEGEFQPGDVIDHNGQLFTNDGKQWRPARVFDSAKLTARQSDGRTPASDEDGEADQPEEV